jgi:hypothetical protein
MLRAITCMRRVHARDSHFEIWPLAVGGSARSVMLQPISVEGSVGIDVTLGVSALTLQWMQ